MTNAAYKAWKLLEGDYTMFEHETIWLQPWCDKCAESGENRLWCQDDVWDQCDSCERKSVKYVIAPAPQPAPAADAALAYAHRLAFNLWQKHWKADAPRWVPLPDMIGLLTQIDNMTVGLIRPAQQPAPADDPYRYFDGASFKEDAAPQPVPNPMLENAWEFRGLDANEIIEACARVVDACNREGPYQAIAAASRIRALKAAPSS